MITTANYAYITAAALLLIPVSSKATVYFQNSGTISGWTEADPQHNGTITQVSSPTYKGSTALRMTQTFDGSYSGRYHSETVKSTTQSNGQDRYYGQTIYLPSNWVYINQNATFQQFSPES